MVDKEILEIVTNKKRMKEYYWPSPHAGQAFCELDIFAPHSTQYLVVLLLS